MAIRVYYMPQVTGVKGIEPKYLSLLTDWTSLQYGDELICAVEADLAPSDHATLVGMPDVVSPPPDLSDVIGAQLNVVRNSLELMNIPTGWVLNTFTYAQVIRVVGLMFYFMQKYSAKGVGRLFTGGVTLDTHFNQLPVGVRNALIATANDLNFDTSSLSGASTVRVILKALADQFPNIQIFIGAIEI